MGQGMTAILLMLVTGTGPAASPAPPAAGDRTSLPDRCLGVRMQPLLLLSRADVRADVGLEAPQAEAVDKAILDLVARASEVRHVTGPAAVEARRDIDRAAHEWLQRHLREDQYQRLLEVDLQWEGLSSMISRPLVARHLDLKPEQQRRIKEALDDRNRKRPPGTFRKEVERAFAEKVRTVLTPKQRQMWSSMVGRPFVPQLSDAPPAQEAASPAR